MLGSYLCAALGGGWICLCLDQPRPDHCTCLCLHLPACSSWDRYPFTPLPFSFFLNSQTGPFFLHLLSVHCLLCYAMDGVIHCQPQLTLLLETCITCCTCHYLLLSHNGSEQFQPHCTHTACLTPRPLHRQVWCDLPQEEPGGGRVIVTTATWWPEFPCYCLLPISPFWAPLGRNPSACSACHTMTDRWEENRYLNPRWYDGSHIPAHYCHSTATAHTCLEHGEPTWNLPPPNTSATSPTICSERCSVTGLLHMHTTPSTPS